MTSRSNPDWLSELIATEGDARPIDADERSSLMGAIASATSPEPLDPGRHQQLLDTALGRMEDPFAPPSEHEAHAAATAMADPLVASLSAAYAPARLSPDRERAVNLSALHELPAPIRGTHSGRTAGVWGVLAAAAMVLLWIATQTELNVGDLRSNGRARANLTPVRSTGAMFAEPFATSTASERIDRIAQARQKDLRANRYLLWGVP